MPAEGQDRDQEPKSGWSISTHTRLQTFFAGIGVLTTLFLGCATLAVEIAGLDESKQKLADALDVPTETATRTITVVEEPPPPPPPSGGYDGLQELVNNQDVAELEFGEYESQKMAGGRVLEDGFSAVVYGDEGDWEVPMTTGDRYTQVSGFVGVDNDTECRQNRAEVQLSDSANNVLWGPRQVGFDDLVEFEANITDLNQVIFRQRTLEPADDNCNGGVMVAWGRVRFAPAVLEPTAP